MNRPSTIKMVIDGFNEFLQRQKAVAIETPCTVSVLFFSHSLDVLYQDQPLDSTCDLSIEDYHPGGSTALRDAMAEMLRNARDAHIVNGATTIAVVLTDGYENCSTTSIQDLQDLITETSPYVHIAYMGSNQDAILAGGQIGASMDASLNYNDEFLLEAIESTSEAVGRFRSGATIGIEYSLSERAASSGGSTIDFDDRMDFAGRSSSGGDIIDLADGYIPLAPEDAVLLHQEDSLMN